MAVSREGRSAERPFDVSGAAPSFSFAQPHGSRRAPVLARQMVTTSQPLAAQAGLRMLEAGGTAADAAIATAAALVVVEPTMNGLGSDAFALVWDGAKLHGLNASGRSPRAWSLSRFAGRRHMPELGWDAVTVPGAVSGWVALWRRFGRLPFATLLEPAIRYARDGYHVTPHVAELWAEAPARFAGFDEFQRAFLAGGPPRAGDLVRLPALASSLASIAETLGASFYRGDLARRIAQAAHSEGGALSEEDLAAHAASWVEPISIDYRGITVHELPPNGQGLASLIALGILDRLPLAEKQVDSADAVHLQIEAMKSAFAECQRHLADPEAMTMSTHELLAPDRLLAMARAIRIDRAAAPMPPPSPDHGTVYAATADAAGSMVSFIQSNYLGFGSGVVIPGTGISLQNRGMGFVLDPEHPNCVAGGKLPYHTIMPGFATQGGQAAMAFGVMGGHMQPQGHVQMVLRSFLYRENPQAACDAPRWHVTPESAVALEPALAARVGDELGRRGHTLVREPTPLLFGGAQAIRCLPTGYCAGSDPRKDGQAVGL